MGTHNKQYTQQAKRCKKIIYHPRRLVGRIACMCRCNGKANAASYQAGLEYASLSCSSMPAIWICWLLWADRLARMY
eukprot:1143060-Pelagomonas_calceolata.AAC.1